MNLMAFNFNLRDGLIVRKLQLPFMSLLKQIKWKRSKTMKRRFSLAAAAAASTGSQRSIKFDWIYILVTQHESTGFRVSRSRLRQANKSIDKCADDEHWLSGSISECLKSMYVHWLSLFPRAKRKTSREGKMNKNKHKFRITQSAVRM